LRSIKKLTPLSVSQIRPRERAGHQTPEQNKGIGEGACKVKGKGTYLSESMTGLIKCILVLW